MHETRGTWGLLSGHCSLTSAKYSTDLTVGDLTCHQTRRGCRPAPSTAAAGLLRCGDAPRPAPGGGRASPRGAPGATSSHFSCLQSAVGRPVPFASRDELGDGAWQAAARLLRSREDRRPEGEESDRQLSGSASPPDPLLCSGRRDRRTPQRTAGASAALRHAALSSREPATTFTPASGDRAGRPPSPRVWKRGAPQACSEGSPGRPHGARSSLK